MVETENRLPSVVAQEVQFITSRNFQVIIKVNETFEHDFTSLATVLAPHDWFNVVIAYEPKQTLSVHPAGPPPKGMAFIHAKLRAHLSHLLGAPTANFISIIYGGKVTAKSALGLLRGGHVQGFLASSTSNLY